MGIHIMLLKDGQVEVVEVNVESRLKVYFKKVISGNEKPFVLLFPTRTLIEDARFAKVSELELSRTNPRRQLGQEIVSYILYSEN